MSAAPVVVCAVDAGATWSKGALVALDGPAAPRLLAAAAGGPGNAHVVGEAMATSHLAGLLLTLHLAAGCDPRATASVAVGVSTPAIGHAAAELVLPDRPAVCVPDVELLTGGVPAPVVAVVAGTGSIAQRSAGPVRRAAGGHGWYLGDEGGASALGRAALRAVLDGTATPALVAAVQTTAGLAAPPGPASPELLHRWVYRDGTPQRAAARLAPAVTGLARQGDAVATALVTDAVQALVALAETVGEPGDALVFGGSVASALSPELLARTAGWRQVTVHTDGVVGAAVLAADAVGVPVDPAALVPQWTEHRATLTIPR